VELRLLVKKGRTTTNQLAIRKFPTFIGRHRDCNLRIAARQVSRRHCVLKARDGWLIVCDLGSCNGTLVNGQHVHGERILHPGDELEIGPITFEISYNPPAVALTSAEAADTLVMAQSTAFDECSPDPSDNAYEISERMAELERAAPPQSPPSDSGDKIVMLDENAEKLSPAKRLFSVEVSEGDTVHQRT
jgi:pSer/pThr/pTyr-binding forkhead associated (FHA) protein